MTQPPAQPVPGEGLTRSIAALALANLIPVAGILFMGWDLRTVLLAYWLESAVVGFYGVMRLLIVGRAPAVPMGVFFTIHYGVFMMAHLIFLIALTGEGGVHERSDPFTQMDRVLTRESLLMGLVLLGSHGLSFVDNFLRRERHRLTPKDLGRLMFQPYGRIIVMHLTLLLGAFAVQALGMPQAVLALFVILKTIVDIRAHQSERRKLGKPRS